MESVGILRVLWRRPVVLALGALLALAVGLLAAYQVSLGPPGLQSRATTSGYALQRVLVDTPTSLVADASPKGATSIMVRATILADQMAGDEARTTMARELGLRPGEIGVLSSGTSTPQTETPLAQQALEATRPHDPYVVDLSLETSQPIVSIRATAPDSRQAGELAKATTRALVLAASRPSLSKGAVRVERLGGAEIGSRQISPGKKKAAIAALFIFVAWCTAIVVFDGLARRRHPSSSWGGREDVPV